MQPIAYIRSPFAEKFGVPRQGNLAPHVISEIVFEPEFRNEDCVRGLEKFSHIWLIWQFHCNGRDWHPTERPARRGWGVTPAWGCLPRVRPSVRTAWAFPW